MIPSISNWGLSVLRSDSQLAESRFRIPYKVGVLLTLRLQQAVSCKDWIGVPLNVPYTHQAEASHTVSHIVMAMVTTLINQWLLSALSCVGTQEHVPPVHSRTMVWFCVPCINYNKGNTVKWMQTQRQVCWLTFATKYCKKWPLIKKYYHHRLKAQYITVRIWPICIFYYISIDTTRKAADAWQNTRSR